MLSNEARLRLRFGEGKMPWSAIPYVRDKTGSYKPIEVDDPVGPDSDVGPCVGLR